MTLLRGASIRRSIQLLVSCILITTLAACAGKTIKTVSTDGRTKQVFNWAFWNGRSCQATDFTIKITKAPEHGEVEIVGGTMRIGEKSATGARMSCEGKTVANKLVNYTATKGFSGTDEIRLSIIEKNTAPRLFTLEIAVY